ncbi:MAG TPA: hypothetical protein VLV17_03960 [Anaeromyxobacteraceae bacterium]|nr:hypothetical protein [Anaeromyxobacteraceae bacterium]
MTTLIALALVTALPARVPAPVVTAVAAAVAPPASRAEALEMSGSLPDECLLVRAELPSPVTASGRVPVHLLGEDTARHRCEGWAWVKVRASARSLVTTREVPQGESLAGAVAPAEVEVLQGRPPLEHLPEGARAERSLPAGAAVDESLVRVGPRPGEPVEVVLHAGALSVEAQGRATPCQRGRACALLASGRRVEGEWHDGRIVLELP